MALRKIESVTGARGNLVATVYRDAANAEFVVRFATGGKRNPDADYFTDDKGDAQRTARAFAWPKGTETRAQHAARDSAFAQLATETREALALQQRDEARAQLAVAIEAASSALERVAAFETALATAQEIAAQHARQRDEAMGPTRR